MKYDLASGQWIDIVPLQGLKAKHRDAHDGAPKLYMKFRDDGTPDLSGMPVSMSVAKAQRNGLLASLLLGWSFTADDGVPLPLPGWANDEIVNDDSLGELPLDDFLEIEGLLAPYLEKVQRRPDPKTTTTAGSSATSKARAVSRTV